MKKLLLGLGTLGAIVAPIATVVACGTGESTYSSGEKSLNAEQTSVNKFVLKSLDSDKGVIVNNKPFTPELAKKYGLSNGELYNDKFEYSYTSSPNGITIVVTKIENSLSLDDLNSITQAQIEEYIDVKVDSTKFPSQVDVPMSLEITPTSNPSAKATVYLTWMDRDSDGTLMWNASVKGRTNLEPLTNTIKGFKSTQMVAEKNANSITQAQLDELINARFDKTKLPSQVDVPMSLEITPTYDASAKATVYLTWMDRDSDGTLMWSASIPGRTNSTLLSNVISGFKTTPIIEEKEWIAPITQVSIEELINVSPDKTKLPSEMINLPLSVMPNSESLMKVTWVRDDVHGTLTWSSTIHGATTSTTFTNRIEGFKVMAISDAEKNANSITQAQIEKLINIKPDKTKLPSQVYVPMPTQISLEDDPSIKIPLFISVNDDNDAGTLTWSADVSGRTTPLTNTISGFKTTQMVNEEDANSITQAQIEKVIGISSDLTKFPSQVANLPTALEITPTTNPSAKVKVYLTWADKDSNGTLTWSGAIDNRTKEKLSDTIQGFRKIDPELKKEQESVNKLLSMGSTVDSLDRVQATEVLLDKAAIDKYGIKYTDGTSYMFNPNFTYSYTATAESIKIYVSRDFKKGITKPKEILISKNSYTGTFSSIEKAKEFLAITTVVPNLAFQNARLTTISLPQVRIIEGYAFFSSPLTSLSLPEVKTIGINAFNGAQLKELWLPEVTSIGACSFQNSRLQSIYAPKVTSIEEDAFMHVDNSAWTKITLPINLNSFDVQKRAFNAWGGIHFVWVDTSGVIVGETVQDRFVPKN